MTASVHPAAPHDLPAFITAPGDTDVLMVTVAVILIGAVVAFGVLFFRLHSLPEQIAHKRHAMQIEIVAALCLISLFTHIHAFWVAGLILALIEFPDFSSIFGRIAGSVEKIAASKPGEAAIEVPETPSAGVTPEKAPAPEAARVRSGKHEEMIHA